MHTTTVIVDGQTYHAHHNGDWSGDVRITTPEKAAPGMIGSMDLTVLECPFELLEELVGQKIKDMVIDKLEQMTGQDVLLGGLCIDFEDRNA